ncbi:pksN [Symbiodinium pilosum]|uniref:PksN protein n=1 Tax=Symbiodinium pilosum TaxID=2952 RepID=A0A812QNR7_SYMPI|nr:pksN [Symbiodinium pilosum]
MGKGAGKAAQPNKRTREQEDEEEFWMDAEQLDEETIRRILRTLVRAAARREQQLTSLEADRSYVLFLETGNHGMINVLAQAGASNSGDGQLDFADSAPQKKALPASKDNLTHENAKQAVANLLKNTATDGIVHRSAEVVVMLLTLTLHQQAADVYRDLDLLANNCAGKVIGLRLRRERVSNTTLAKELEKLQL